MSSPSIPTELHFFVLFFCFVGHALESTAHVVVGSNLTDSHFFCFFIYTVSFSVFFTFHPGFSTDTRFFARLCFLAWAVKVLFYFNVFFLRLIRALHYKLCHVLLTQHGEVLQATAPFHPGPILW